MILDTATEPFTAYVSSQEQAGCPEGTTKKCSSTWCHSGHTYRACACCVDPMSLACDEKLQRLTEEAMEAWPPNC